MKKFPLFITALAIFLSAAPTAFAWNNPTANPAAGVGVFYVESGTPANSLYIKSNGNVGIGTTNPGYKLSAQGPYASPQALIGYDGSNGIFFQAQGTTTHTNWLIGQQRTVGGLEFTPSTLAGGTTFSTPAIVILNNSGNVGIGMTNPTERLDVTGNIRASGTITATSFSGGLSGTVSAANVSAGAFGANTGGGNYTFPGTLGSGAFTANGNITALGGDLISNTTSVQGYPDLRLQGVGTEVIARNDSARLWLMSATTGTMRVNIADAYDNDRGVGLAYTPGTSGTPGGIFDIGQTQKNAATYTHGITRFYTNGTEQVRIDSAGNVGINTTNPGYKLEINGDVLNRGKQYQYTQLGQGSGAHGISWYAPSYYTWYDYMAPPGTTNSPSGTPAPTDAASGVTSWARRFNIENAGGYGWIFESGTNASASAPTVKFAINSNNGNFHFVGNGYIDGNVGIGTTAPSAGLDVQKAVTASALVANGVNLQQTLTATANNDVLSALRVNPTFTVGAFTGVSQYAINATGTIKATSFEGALSGTTSAANISSGSFGANTGGGNYSFPANVGINTTTPENWLHIRNTRDTTANPDGVGLTLESAVSTNQKYQIGVGVSGISNQFLSVRDITAGAYRMVVNTSGNVGIGTTSPGAPLHIAGALTGGSDWMQLERTGVRTWAFGSSSGYFNLRDATASTYPFIVEGAAPSNSLYVKGTTGNVGIGTASPVAKLQSSGATSATSPTLGSATGAGLLVTNTDAAYGLLAGVAATGNTWLQSQRVDGAATSYGLSLNPSGGNVGIGTTAPTTSLHIKKSGTPTITLEDTSGGTQTAQIVYSQSGANNLDIKTNYVHVSNRISLIPGGVTTLSALGSGNVGIGTTSPAQKLDVAGGVKMMTLNQGAGTNERFYPNVVSVNNDGTATTGAWIINTPVTRASNQMFRIRVHGYAYGNQDSVDFTIVGYPYSGSTGSIDGLGGAIVSYDLQDNGTDGLEKWVGVNSAGNVAIALGNTTLSSYFYRLSVDAWITRTTADYSSGWSITQSTVANFGFLDIKGPLTSSIKNTVFIASNGNVGIGATNPTASLDVQKAVTASATVANGVNLQQTLTAAANNDVLSALRVNPTFTVGAFTGVSQYAINATGTIKGTAFEGALSGTVSAANVSSGSFGANTGGGNYTFPATVSATNVSITSDGGALKLYGTGGASTHVYTEYYAGGAAGGRYAWVGYGSGGSQDFSVMNQRPTGNLYLATNGVNQLTISSAGNVGIGTTSPTSRLTTYYLSTVAPSLTWDSFAPVNFRNEASELVMGLSNAAPYPYFMQARTNASSARNIAINPLGGGVSVGSIDPGPTYYKFYVGSGGGTTAMIGSASTDTVFIGGGAGKLNVGTIDPIYTIGDKRYATYTTAMTGVKEETSGTIKLQKDGSLYAAALDFGSAKEGSDLWLFYQVTDFSDGWDKLTILLSSNFDGPVWYEKNPERKTVSIYGEPKDESKTEVSYRLTAPRFDHKKWSNRSTDEAEGFKLDVK